MSSKTKNRTIYLDYAAATPVNQKVLKEVVSVSGLYGNPSSFNDIGREAQSKLEKCRLSIAHFLGARPEEIIFTSSGSEANNMALFGLIKAYSDRKGIITSPIEHPSILGPLRTIKDGGRETIFLKVDSDGFINTEDLKTKINSNTFLVSVMYANNEIGTIQPIKKIAKIIKEYRAENKTEFPILHTDACQATEYLDMNVNNLGVDLMTFNGSKIYGPRGSAVLYKRRGVSLDKWIYGGDQENGFRAGTENLPAIAGLAEAIALINKKEGERLTKLRDYFFEMIIKIMPDIKINGPLKDNRLPNNINISIPGLSDENLLLELDKYGIHTSSGSACTARSVEPSHVLKAVNVPPTHIKGALRLSMGRQTTKKDIDYVLKALPRIVRDLKKRYSID